MSSPRLTLMRFVQDPPAYWNTLQASCIWRLECPRSHVVDLYVSALASLTGCNPPLVRRTACALATDTQRIELPSKRNRQSPDCPTRTTVSNHGCDAWSPTRNHAEWSYCYVYL
ncbi:hypothetical protein EVAR_11415_1 [Eumeta japonica]|uniref:Uncharacterized protein n=1 Tax=Eumeta variegata TaxID=151549 RepID=A0A4C1TNG1_EUMVA|nr:hypothetical protein EVAR_11415_1 [Eumeta japonica]